MMRHSSALTIAAFAALLAATVPAPARAPAPGVGQCAQMIYYGPSQPLGSGTARSWVMLDTMGRPATIGMTLSEAALNGLGDTDSETVLPLPAEALQSTPFTHAVINWNAHGHHPAGIYNVPHFDFHFYTLSPEERAGITGAAADAQHALQKPAAQFLPPGYVADTEVVPHMGVHWVSASAPELHGQPFTQTFVYGFYAGRMAFLEPMVTVAYLRTQPNLLQTVAVPAEYPAAGSYPTAYSIRYDPALHEYRIALEGFVPRGAPGAVRSP